jgi:hypothetical protein
MSGKPAMTIDERRAILEEEIAKQVRAGWTVVSRTDTTAQLTATEGPNGCVLLFLLLFFIIPGILYVLFYKGSKSLYLEVDEQGNVKHTP